MVISKVGYLKTKLQLTCTMYFVAISYKHLHSFHDYIFKNISLCWLLICFMEVFVVKALMLYKFPYMARVDDDFMGKLCVPILEMKGQFKDFY